MRRNRGHYSAVFGAELLLISALVLVVSGPALAQTAAGSFSSVSGRVQIRRAGATIGAASGVGVDVGDRIVTGASGHAVIMLNDQSRLELGPVSSITLDEFTITGGSASTRVSLFSGVLRIAGKRRIGRRTGKLPGAYSQRGRGSARHEVRYRVHREYDQARLPGMRTIY